MRAEQAACFLKNARTIGERPDGVVQATQERLPGLAPPQGLFCAGPLAGRPRPVGGDFNQCDLVAGPDPRRGAVDAECCNPSTILDQRRADKRGSVAREQLLALRVRESRICFDAIDCHGLATAPRVDDGLAEATDRASPGERRDPVRIGPIDDELVSVDVGEVDAAGVEMFADETDGDFLNRDGILERSQVLVERDQEVPLGGHSRRSILVVFAAPF